MFNLNDTVVYGTTGVCVISQITEITVSGKKRMYYVLQPVCSDESKVFVPMDNETLTGKMKKILSEKEVIDILHDKNFYTEWIEDRHLREEKYMEIISRGNEKELISMLRLLYGAKLQAEREGKKQYMADKRVMDMAEKIICDEFSYVMEIPRKGVSEFIYENSRA